MEGNLPAWLPLPPRSLEALPSPSLPSSLWTNSIFPPLGSPPGPPQPTPAVLLTLLLCLSCLPRVSVFYMDQNEPYEIVFSVGQQWLKMGPFIPASLSISLPGCQFPQGLGCLRVAHSPSPDEAPHLGGTQETMGRCLGEPDGSGTAAQQHAGPKVEPEGPGHHPWPRRPRRNPGRLPGGGGGGPAGRGGARRHPFTSLAPPAGAR